MLRRLCIVRSNFPCQGDLHFEARTRRIHLLQHRLYEVEVPQPIQVISCALVTVAMPVLIGVVREYVDPLCPK